MDWLKHYESLLKCHNYKDALYYKKEHMPLRLYKYRSLTDELLNNIKNDTIWLSSPLKMNDPYECSMHISFIEFSNYLIKSDEFWQRVMKINSITKLSNDDIDQIRKSEQPYSEYFKVLETKYNVSSDRRIFLDNELRQHVNFMIEGLIEALKNSVRFCSFSERYDSLLMWSHYADQHRGVCIEYDIKSSSFLSNLCFPVIYTNNVFDATEYYKNNEKAVTLSLAAAIYKQHDWNYEKEWRIMVTNNLLTEDRNIPAVKPTAIFVGSETCNLTGDKERIYEELQEIAIDRDIDFRFMQLDRSNFKMEPIIV